MLLDWAEPGSESSTRRQFLPALRRRMLPCHLALDELLRTTLGISPHSPNRGAW